MTALLDGTQTTDQDFVVGAWFDAPPAQRTLRPESKRRSVGDALAGPEANRWIERKLTYADFPPEAMDVGPSGMFLPEREAQFLHQMRLDIAQLNEAVRSSQEVAHCRRFVENVGLALARIPRVRCAVFGEEEDGVELVAHSRASMRQVSFEFRPESNSINIISIDENMRRFERGCEIDMVRTLAEAIGWLNPH